MLVFSAADAASNGSAPARADEKTSGRWHRASVAGMLSKHAELNSIKHDWKKKITRPMDGVRRGARDVHGARLDRRHCASRHFALDARNARRPGAAER